jgi:hypothetical protein
MIEIRIRLPIAFGIWNGIDPPGGQRRNSAERHNARRRPEEWVDRLSLKAG